MQAKLNELLAPGTRIEISATLPVNPLPEKKILLLLEVSSVFESHMQDGKLFDLVILNPNGAVGHMMVHEKELAGQSWFNSRLLKFIK